MQDQDQVFEDKNETPVEETNEQTDHKTAEEASESEPKEITEAAEPAANEVPAPEPVYGAVYAPAADGSYTCVRYSGEAESADFLPPKKEKKKKNGGRAALIAVLCAICILLSGLAGFTGAYLAGRALNNPSIGEGIGTEEPGETAKIKVSVADVPANGASIDTVSVPRGTKMSIVDTVKVVKNTVVEITTETVQKGNPFFGDYITSGAGSGVIISADGYIVTNNHVIEDATSISVRLPDGKEYPAEFIGTDEDFDVAVIRIKPENGEKFPYAVMGNSDTLEVGEDIIVIGNPLGQLGGTVTNGIISAKERAITVNGETMTLLQTNAAVNPGNSGGGMFNLYGELVGVINAKSSGENIEGLGFAIPINTAYIVATEIIEYGYVRGKPTLGIAIVDVSDRFQATYYFNSSSLGVYVYEASEESGFRYGDRIISCNGQEISTCAQFQSLIKDLKVGDTIEVKVMRAENNRRVEVVVKATLVEKVPASQTAAN